MSDSILTSTKSTLGIAEDYTAFDPEITIHINAALADLNQLGVGPTAGFAITDSTQKWSDFLGDEHRLNSVKSYMHLRVKLLFDPPQTGFVLTAMKQQMEEAAWRVTVAADEIDRPPAEPTIVVEEV